MYIPDNYDKFREHDARQNRWLRSRPICIRCREPIQDDYGYDDGDGLMCAECWDERVREEYRVDVDNYVDSLEGW